MIPRDCWEEVTEGLLNRGVCGVFPLENVFRVDDKPILGGIFGVPKGKATKDGVEIFRLIMDLRPINCKFLSLGGDLESLPMISQLFQLELQPHEQYSYHLKILKEQCFTLWESPKYGISSCALTAWSALDSIHLGIHDPTSYTAGCYPWGI